jgi:hypothetical protein
MASPSPSNTDVENVPPSKEEMVKDGADPYLVHWEENEQANPKNWSTVYKCFITFQLGMVALAASLGSSIISPAEAAIGKYTGVGREVSVLCVSLYM